METRGANCAKFRNREFEDLLLSVPIVMFQQFYDRIKLANKEPTTTWHRQYVFAFNDFLLHLIINLFCTCASNFYGNFFHFRAGEEDSSHSADALLRRTGGAAGFALLPRRSRSTIGRHWVPAFLSGTKYSLTVLLMIKGQFQTTHTGWNPINHRLSECGKEIKLKVWTWRSFT